MYKAALRMASNRNWLEAFKYLIESLWILKSHSILVFTLRARLKS
jgi:hypothetical protein